MGFIKRHWKGEVSLPISYWVVGWGVNLLAIVVAASFTAFVQSRPTFNPIVVFASYVILMAFIAVLCLWQFVGVWRSACRYIATPGKPGIWGFLAILAVLMGGANLVLVYSRDVIPAVKELYSVAFSGDPAIPSYRITLSENGRELKIEGGIKFGLLDDVKAALASSPATRTINLESVGGRIGVAEDLYTYLSSLEINTVTNGVCLSACTYVFASGKNRWLGPNGRLGFHSASFANWSDREANKASNDLDARISQEKSIPSSFFKKASRVPSNRMWYPDRKELLKNNIITSKISRALSSQRLVERELMAGLAEMRRNLPQAMDKHTTLVDVRVDFMKVSFINEISEDAVRSLNAATNTTQILRKRIAGALCKDKGALRAFEMGVVYDFIYRHHRTKNVILSVEIDGCP